MGINRNIKLIVVVPLFFSGTVSSAVEAKNSESKPTTVSSSSASPNMQNSANKSASQNGAASTISKVIGAANMAMGASKMSAFAASCSGGATCQYSLLAQGILHFAMGAQAFMQAKNHDGAAQQSGLTGVDTSAWNNPFGDPNSTTTNDDPTKDKALAAVVNAGKFSDIKKALTTSGINGVRLDPKTGKITDSNTGKTYDSGALGSAQGMADAGFSAGDIAAAMEASSKAEKAAIKKLGLTEGIGAATAANGYTDDAGSGGTMSGRAGDMTIDGSGGHRGLASSGSGVKIPSNQIAGLTKNFNGERIGVSAENIFNMMARRYKTKEKQNSFFDPSELVKMPQ
jgi:hypothetical protein